MLEVGNAPRKRGSHIQVADCPGPIGQHATAVHWIDAIAERSVGMDEIYVILIGKTGDHRPYRQQEMVSLRALWIG